MYQFFVEEEQVHSDSISITGGDVNHIKNVLRMKNGEKIRVSSKSASAIRAADRIFAVFWKLQRKRSGHR